MIHIWHTKLESHREKYTLFYNWLSPEEKAHAEKLATAYRRRFIISRGILRDLLAYYSEQYPKQLCLGYTCVGKPFLISSPKQTIEFNLSHSQDTVAYAFTIDNPIGIDIEHKTQRKHLDKIAYRFFSACDYDRLKLLSGEEKLRVFFNTWVRNEALLKAFGDRLQTHPFSHYKFSIDTKSISIESIQRKKNQSCCISNLSLYPDVSGAVVIVGDSKPIIIKKYTKKISLS